MSAKNNKNGKIKTIMPLLKYNFKDIFGYQPATGIIIPKYSVVINNVLLPKHIPITTQTYTGGVNLFQYINRDFNGTWNEQTQQLTIEGFY